MRWFEGNVTEAIQLAKSKKSIFLVCIHGDDEPSRQLLASFDDDNVDKRMSRSNCVALKLAARSESGIQFAQIYPVVLVPSVFMIGLNGVPLEVAAGHLSPTELLERFNKVLQLHESQTGPTAGSSSSPPAAVAAVPLETADAAADGDSAAASASSLSLEERKERAMELLAKRREDKAREEDDKEKNSELERRKLGQEMAKLKQFKEDRARKEFENSYKKQKEEDRLAREKVRAELERDRQERALRYQQEKLNREQAQQTAKNMKLAAQAEADAHKMAVQRESARIQFRLPDGSTIVQTFPSSEPLSTARDFILQNMSRRCDAVTLSTVYPRRTFTDADMSLSFLDLELAPSVILVVVPQGSRTSAGNPGSNAVGGVLTLLMWILSPLVFLWNIVYNFLFGTPPQTYGGATVPPPSAQSSSSSTAQRPAAADSQPGPSVRKRMPGTDGPRQHTEGNIRRFTANDEDDDTATWNGNSTQQM